MTANAATLKIELITDDKGSKVIKDFAGYSKKHFTEVSRHVTHKLGGALKGLGRTAGGVFKGITKSVLSLKTAFIGLAAYGMNRVIKGWERLSDVQEKAEAGMIQAMKSMGRHTEVFEQEILDAASALQRMSTFGDENIIMGTKFLMTYKNIGDDVMPEVMKTMTDLAALMKGDFVSAANMLGKASMGMVGELRRVGITVDKETMELEGFAGVLRQIQEQVEGQAAALRDTKYGGLVSFWNVVHDVQEKFGDFTKAIKVYIADEILPYVEQVNEKLQEWIRSGEMEEKARVIGEAIGTWIAGKVEGAIAMFNKLKKKAGEAAEWAVEAWGKFKEKLELIWKVLEPILRAIERVIKWRSVYITNIKQGQAEADAIGAEIGAPIAAQPVTEPGPPEGPREDWTAAEVAQWEDQGEERRVYNINTNNYFDNLSRSDAGNILIEQRRRAERT